MKRRSFIERISVGASLAGLTPVMTGARDREVIAAAERLEADVVIAGAGLGGCAAALAALRDDLTVILTEETDWIGGQLTQQGVPPDEHRWIETHGATQLYRDFRRGIREYYRRNYPLTAAAREKRDLNPGDGAVSRLCHEPRVALAVLNE